MYTLQKSIAKLQKDTPTYFLDPNQQLKLKQLLKRKPYQIYKPYKESEKNIFYTSTPPEVILYEIKCSIPLRHQDILGTIFSLNIKEEMFGDIIIDNDKYYIYIINQIKSYFEANFLKIKNTTITLMEHPLEKLSGYTHKYKDITLIVSSVRIDTVLANLIGTSRPKILEKIKNKEVILNYELLTSPAYLLKENDTFSIRKHGKYKYIKIIKTTKKDNLLISCQKYI